MKNQKPISLGMVTISVIMFFAAVAIDIFWLAKLAGRPFPLAKPVEHLVYEAFALPDIVSSILLYIGAYGLIVQKKFGFVISWVAMGMWIFDGLLVLNVTKLTNINFVGPSLVFGIFSVVYLWRKFPMAQA